MAKKRDISNPERNTLTAEDLKRYEAGEMTFQEMHRVEKILLEQSFYADAAEGLTELKKDKVSTEKNLNDLKTRLGNRLSQTSNKPASVLSVSRIWKPVGIAAALLIVFAGTYYVLTDKQKEADTAITMKSEAKADKLPEPTASAPTAKSDKTALNKPESAPQLTEKRNQAFEHNTQAESIVKKAEELPFIEETIASVVSKPNEANKTSETPPPPVVITGPVVLEKKVVTDSDEASPEKKTLGGAARMARATISGTVVDEENQPMKDVTVNIKGKAEGIKTDEEGKFSLKDARRGDIIIFNSLTMPQMEVPLKSNLPGKIVYSNENIKPPGKEKAAVNSPHDAMLGKALTDARPEFGWEAFEVYLKENTKRPPKALESNIQGRVIVSFMVNEKGELSDFTIIRSIGFGCDEEAIRIIKNGPKWFPATKEDKPVSSSNEVVVKFRQ